MRPPPRPEQGRLSKYRDKRRFEATPEPTGSARLGRAPRGRARFVVQKHDASRLHYDFRLEEDGVLKSWAVPKGPSLDPKERRLAMQVEDHPLDYFDFEGVIPEHNYGAGEVVVWDWGTWEKVDGSVESGKLKFRLDGVKLHGLFTLVHMKGRGGRRDNAWLLFKDRDDAVDPAWTVEAHPESVKTGRTLDDLRAGHADPEPVPRVAQPELATLIDAPFDDPDWLFEVKWDGFRALATIHEDGRVELVSRNGKDLLPRFPRLARLARGFTQAPVIVDGEIVAVDEEGKSSFQRLQNGTGAGGRDVTFVAFDVLYADGRDLRREPLEARKAVLRRLVKKRSRDVVYSEHVVGNGTALFEEAQRRGLEGIVGKRRRAPYVEKRTRDWVKIKAQLVQECVIAGWTEPGGAREGFGSLVLGVYEMGRLVYVGNVGTGFDAKGLRALMRKMKPLARDTCPFAARPKTRTRAHWIEPKLVAQIRFTEWTHDGAMRHPAFLGLRDDKAAKDVHRELPRPHEEVA
jgi:bifunctional non-homologous end joining protein LigD